MCVKFGHTDVLLVLITGVQLFFFSLICAAKEMSVIPTRHLRTVSDLSNLHYRILWGLCEQRGRYYSHAHTLTFDASTLLMDKSQWIQCKRTGTGCSDAMIEAIGRMVVAQEEKSTTPCALVTPLTSAASTVCSSPRVAVDPSLPLLDRIRLLEVEVCELKQELRHLKEEISAMKQSPQQLIITQA